MKDDLIIEREQKSLYEKLANIAVKSLNKRRINAQYASNKEEALRMVMELIPEGTIVGTADSMTLVQVGVFSEIKRRGRNEIINPFIRDDEGNHVLSDEETYNMKKRVLSTDVVLLGTNAITLDGKLVNTDGGGGRVAAMIYGPNKVIIVVGANKIVKNVDDALRRIREVCAPLNNMRHIQKHHSSGELDLPCVKTGVCVDCNSPGRSCNYTTIIEGEKERRRGHLNVIIVGESLGI
jgi:hypothetical protein